MANPENPGQQRFGSREQRQNDLEEAFRLAAGGGDRATVPNRAGTGIYDRGTGMFRANR